MRLFSLYEKECEFLNYTPRVLPIEVVWPNFVGIFFTFYNTNLVHACTADDKLTMNSQLCACIVKKLTVEIRKNGSLMQGMIN